MFISAPDESADSAALYKSSADAEGFVMNFSRAWAWRPDVFAGFATLRQQLTSHSALTRRDLAILVCATAAELGDSYCSLAWGRTLATEAGAAAAAAVIQNSGGDGLGVRDHALAAWARCVVADPNATTGDDVERLRDAGMTDREIFESTVFVAFRLAFSTVSDALGINPDWQLAAQVPHQVLAAVDFGRKVTDAPAPSAEHTP